MNDNASEYARFIASQIIAVTGGDAMRTEEVAILIDIAMERAAERERNTERKQCLEIIVMR